MATLTAPIAKTNPMLNVPVHRRPGAWGFFDEEYVDARPEPNVRQEVPQAFQDAFKDAPSEHLDPSPTLEITFNQPESSHLASEGTLLTFQEVHDTNQQEQRTSATTDNLVNITFNKLDNVIGTFEPLAKTVGSTAAEVSVDVFDIFKQVAGVGEYADKPKAAKNSENKADEEKKLQEAKMRIQQFKMQAQSEKQAAQASKQAQVENVMARVGVSAQEVVVKASSGNLNYTESITIANIFWVAQNRVKQVAKRIMPSAGKGKAKQGLQLNSSAQEGQSLVSSAGAIASAG